MGSEQEFETHLELLRGELIKHWSPLPGLGDPFERHKAIENAINSANERAEKSMGHWNSEQQIRHLHLVVEAIGALANNLSSVALLFSSKQDNKWVLKEKGLGDDLVMMLKNALYCHARARELLFAAPRDEIPFLLTNTLSIETEVLGIRCIASSEAFVPRSNSVRYECREGIVEAGQALMRVLERYSSYFAVRASASWLEAKVKSILDTAGTSTDKSYFDLAVSAEDDPRTALEISKLAISETSSLADNSSLLDLIDGNIQSLCSKHGLWSEEHRVALASIQSMAQEAILRSARTGEAHGLKAAGKWANALHAWGVGNSISGWTSKQTVAHFVASDESMGRIRLRGEHIEYDEVILESAFWSKVLTLHSSFDDEVKNLESISKPMRKSIRDSLGLLLDEPNEGSQQAIFHGRAALIPWFALFVGGSPWASQTVRGVLASDAIRTMALGPSRRFFAVVDDALGAHASQVVDAWKKYSGCSDRDILRINSTNESSNYSCEILNRMEGSEEILFFGHGTNQMTDFRVSRMRIGPDQWLGASDISALSMSKTKRLFLISCGSGQANIGVPVSSMSDVFSARGVSNVISTLWSVQSNVGKSFLESLLNQLKVTGNLQEAWVSVIKKNPSKYGYFSLSVTEIA